MSEKRPKDRGRYVIMGFAGLIGISLLSVSVNIPAPHDFWKSFIEHAGTAVFIAAVLGFTIDWWLTRQITEDVFRAAMGYELPDDLKNEIRFVYGNRILCDEHIQTVLIEPLDANFVKVTVGLERRFKNIGQTNQTLSLGIGIDEFNVPSAPSKLIELEYVKGGKRTVLDIEKLLLKERPEGPEYIGPELTLDAEEKNPITVFLKFSETKPTSGEQTMTFSNATINPRVTVEAPEDFGWKVNFPHRVEPTTGRYSKTASLKGLLLPHQSIRIRWWKQ